MKKTILPYHKSPRVYCVDAGQWDFKTKLSKMGYGHNRNLHQEDMTDLYLTKPDVDMRTLNDTCLFSVGGYIHYHDTDGNGIFLKDAAITQKNIESNHIGIINFEEVGGRLDIHRIHPTNCFSADELDGMSSRCMMRIPNARFGDSLVGLVICGELHWVYPHIGEDGHKQEQNELVKLINDETLMIDFNKWHLLSKISKYKSLFNSKPYMGLTPYKDHRIKVEEVKSDQFIRSLFELSQTFVVIVRTPKPLTISKKMVAKVQIPHRYVIGTNQNDNEGFAYEPLRLSDGRYAPYFIEHDEIYTTINTEDNMIYPQLMDLLDRDDQPYLAETNISSRRGEIMTGHFITIQPKEV